jgi:hypothetical protein
MLKELLIQWRKTALFYGVAVALVGGLRLFEHLTESELGGMLYALGLLIIWVLMIAVAGTDLFGYYWSSRDLFLLLAPWPQGALLAGKSAIHGAWFTVAFAVSWLGWPPRFNTWIWDGQGGMLAVVGERAVGVVAFFCVLAVLLRLTKLIRNRAVAVGMIVLAYGGFTVGGVGALIAATGANETGRFWAIGLDSSVSVPPRYVNLLPVLLGATDDGVVLAGSEVASLVMNCAVITLCLGLWLASRRIRVNFVPS